MFVFWACFDYYRVQLQPDGCVIKSGRSAPCLMTRGARSVPAHFFYKGTKNSDASYLACAAVVIYQIVCYF